MVVVVVREQFAAQVKADHARIPRTVIYPSLVNSDANLERIRMPLIQFAILLLIADNWIW